MESTDLGSRIYKESSTVNWRLKGFNLMPFVEDHPVCGPWFMLGKNRHSTWSMVMTKEVHGGVENVGFKLMRADDDTMWDMITFSLGLKTDDGWFVSCIQNQVVGKESSDNPYVFLVRPSKSGVVGMPSEVGLFSGSGGVSVKKSANVEKVRDLIELASPVSSVIEGSTAVKESSTTVENLELSPKVKGATLVESGYNSEGSPGAKASTDVENCVVKENGLGSEPPVIIINFAKYMAAQDAEECLQEETPEPLDPNVEVVEGSPEAKASTDVENCVFKTETQHLTPEELFQQENITVVCEIEYTYMMGDPIPDKDESLEEDTPNHLDKDKPEDHPDLIEALSYLLDSGKFSDITLKCEGFSFPCHKAIVCTRSELIRKFVDGEESVPELNLEKEASTNLVLKSNQEEAPTEVVLKSNEGEASSDLSLKSNQEEEPSESVLKSNQEEASSNIVLKSNEEEASSDLVQKLNKEEASALVPKPNLDKEASPNSVPKPILEKEESSNIVLKLNLDLTTAKALLRYMYTNTLEDNIKTTEDDLLRLHKASLQFGIPGLKELCMASLMELYESKAPIIKKKTFFKKLSEKFSRISVLEDGEKTSVIEEAPVSNIGTQTITTN